MVDYEVYATRWDDPHIIEQIPARGLEFSLPLNDHGECSFSATVEPGRSVWRPALSPVVSGVVVTRDNVPVWSGMVWAENQTGPRTFDFQCAEWGSVFEKIPAPAPLRFTKQGDVYILRRIVELAQLVSGQDFLIETNPDAVGTVTSDYTVNLWDDKTVDDAIRELGNAQDGPDWYFHTTGTRENPVRRLIVQDYLGYVDTQAVLEYVESTEAYRPPEAPPQLTLLGNLFPGQQPQAVVGLEGGNVIAHPARTRDGSQSATVAVALGAGEESAQLRRSASSSLIGAGFPRITRTAAYSDVSQGTTLQRHADGDLASTNGLVTGYTLTTFDGEPDWTQVLRGSLVTAILDTDVYGGTRTRFDARLLDVAVLVDDDGPAQVNWTVAPRLEV